jgi:hypothetical protein
MAEIRVHPILDYLRFEDRRPTGCGCGKIASGWDANLRAPTTASAQLPVSCLVSNLRSEQFVRNHGGLHTDKECYLSESSLIPLLDVPDIESYIAAVFTIAVRSLKCGGNII